MTQTNTISLEKQIKELALNEGTVLVGICEASVLMNKEFSDPNYLLPGARSVISVALNQNEDSIRNYLAKESRDSFCLEADYIEKKLYTIGETIKSFLEECGFKAFNCKINFDYRNAKANEVTNRALETLVDLKNKQKDERF